jgi:Myb-like DNA-binding domain
MRSRQSNWTPEEDRRLLEPVEAHKSWVFISANLKRPAKSVRNRLAYLRQAIKAHADFLPRMQQTFLEIVLIQSVRPILTAIAWLKHRAPCKTWSVSSKWKDQPPTTIGSQSIETMLSLANDTI